MGNLLLVIVIIAVVILYFWAISPRGDKNRRRICLSYAEWDYAHRGLWDMEQNIPENSLPAYERAMRENEAIELDVHLTKDRQLVVIHDSNLQRLCGVDGIVEDMTYAELSQLTLCGTPYGIPLLREVLQTVQGQVPLLIELKTLQSRDTAICSAVYKELEFYNGTFLIESFNPYLLRWFRQHAPHILTGQLAAGPAALPDVNPVQRVLLWLLLVHVISRPDFISYELRSADCISVRINQFLYRTPVFVWTIRSMNEYRQGTAQYDTVIFEHFLP
ncbi:MAG: glycerophosphodiester phosphodiesterase [Eubacterium sp.]|nr:glycerophosphodiester phosphodiesterase [Eubacterium sp.]